MNLRGGWEYELIQFPSPTQIPAPLRAVALHCPIPVIRERRNWRALVGVQV